MEVDYKIKAKDLAEFKELESIVKSFPEKLQKIIDTAEKGIAEVVNFSCKGSYCLEEQIIVLPEKLTEISCVNGLVEIWSGYHYFNYPQHPGKLRFVPCK